MSTHPTIALRDASFSHDASSALLFSKLNIRFPSGFTGIVGANGAGKTTLVRVAVGQLPLSSGSREGPLDAVYCAQRTDTPPAGFAQFLDDWEPETCALKSQLEVEWDYLDRWKTLSHGERKRAQIAHALWQSPELLAIDEPSNHLDARGRRLLIDALQGFKGVGLVVSHDRALLDQLCVQCVWLEPPEVQVFPGGFSQAQAQRVDRQVSAARTRQKLLAESRQLEKAVNARRERAAKEHQARSKRNLSRKDSDARDKINRARVTDGNAGSGLRQLSGRADQLAQQLATAEVKKTHTTGIWLEGSVSKRDALLALPEGSLPLSQDRLLRWPDVLIKPQSRIALTGANGAGKSTLMHHVLPRINAPDDQVLFLPQEITAVAARQLHEQCQRLSHGELGQVMNIVSRLNSRPGQLLESQQPSPGETRKLALALGMMRRPHIIVLDEPTNHLDLPSVEALEQALTDCPCALLVISHDEHFIDQIGADRWELQRDSDGHSLLLT